MDNKGKNLFSLAQEAEFNFNKKHYQQRLTSNLQNSINDVLFNLSFKFQLQRFDDTDLTSCCRVFSLFGLCQSHDTYAQTQQKMQKEEIFKYIRYMGNVIDELKGKLDINTTNEMIISLREFKVIFLMYIAEIKINDTEDILMGEYGKFADSIKKIDEFIKALEEYRKSYDRYVNKEYAHLIKENEFLRSENVLFRKTNKSLQLQLNDAMEFDQSKRKKRSVSTSDILDEKKALTDKTYANELKKSKKEIRKLKKENQALATALQKKDQELALVKQQNTLLASSNFRSSVQTDKLEKEIKMLTIENKAVKAQNEQLKTENKNLIGKLDAIKKEPEKSRRQMRGNRLPKPRISLFPHFWSPRVNENPHKSDIPTPQIKFGQTNYF